MKYLGIDYHKKYSYGSLMDEKGKLIKEGQMENSLMGVKEFVRGNEGEIGAVMEATRNWTVMYDMLEEVAEEVNLAHPLKVKAIADAKIKTDKIDARVLAHLLRCDLLPKAYVPSKEGRYARAVLRQRMFYVRMQTMVKNRIKGIMDKHPEVNGLKYDDIFGKTGIKWLKEVELPEQDRKIIDGDIKLLERLKEAIESSNELIEEIAEGNERVKYLESVPGIGRFFAVLIDAEIGEVERFREANKLHAYVGLIPSTYGSGGRIVHGHITKQGNKWLRWALVEAVWPAIRKDESLRYYYEKLKRKKGANAAKVATARRLLTIVYNILKDRRNFEIRRSPSYLPNCSTSKV